MGRLTDHIRASCAAIAAEAQSVSIDRERLAAFSETGPPTHGPITDPGLDPTRHYLEGAPEDVAAAGDVPPFDNSAVDGFAVRAGPARLLEVTGEARAGHPWAGEVGDGSAVRISTGAMVPAGATAVVPGRAASGKCA